MEAVYAVVAAFIMGQIGDQIRALRLQKTTNEALTESAPQRAIEAVSLVLTEQRKSSEYTQGLLKEQIIALQETARRLQDHITLQDQEIIHLRERVAKLEPSTL